MKKINIILLTVMAIMAILVMPVSADASEAPAPGEIYFDDGADLLRNTDEKDIQDKMRERAAETGWNIVIVTEIGEFTSSESEGLLQDIYHDKFGDADGVGFIMTTEVGNPPGENDYMLSIYTFGTARMQDSRDTILQAVNKPFLDYNEYGSAMAFLNKCKVYVPPEPYRLEPWRLIYPGVFFGGIPALICIFVVIARYKAHPKVSATRYLNLNETRFWRRADTFVREFTTRVPVSTGGSGGGGGGRSGGGGFSGGGSIGGRR
jgi:uncharacterized membrane protein YgcG